MKEQVEQLLAEARASWRFRWPAIVTAWIVGISGAIVVLMLPDRYESRAQVYVDTTSILKPLLQGIAVSPSVENSADVVRRAMLSRPNLERVSRKAGLLVRARTAEEIDRALADIEKAITITGDPRVSVYTIAFTHSSARKAQAVVQDLLDGFVEDSLGRIAPTARWRSASSGSRWRPTKNASLSPRSAWQTSRSSTSV
ncbi:MAG: hypothetical protein IPI06_03895 [Gammaproteobacteria bacterium]|nr:hypothetical protein [Gammaproteobacteria bacterium]